MSRRQLCIVVLGAVLVVLALTFPPWVVRHSDGDVEIDGRVANLSRDLGRSWIGSPPDKVTPGDLEFVWDPAVSVDDRKRLGEREASKYAAPAIDWRSQVGALALILVFTHLVVRWLGRKWAATQMPSLPSG